MQQANALLWDFEGTLAVRPGRFASALVDAAKKLDENFFVSIDTLRPLLSPAFPWHHKQLEHGYAHDPVAWWQNLESYSERALQQLGLSAAKAEAASKLSRSIYLDIRYWRCLDGALDTLDALSARGWVHFIMSNFAPELDTIAIGLGLSERVAMVFSSARIGFEKPHPDYFTFVMSRLGSSKAVWMIGDNVDADIRGGRAAGLKTMALLVLGPVDKPRPDADASEQDESHEAGGELVISSGDAPLLLEMANEALNP